MGTYWNFSSKRVAQQSKVKAAQNEAQQKIRQKWGTLPRQIGNYSGKRKCWDGKIIQNLKKETQEFLDP